MIPLRKLSPIFRLDPSFFTHYANRYAPCYVVENSPAEIEPGPMSISRHHPLLDFNTFAIATLGMEVCGAVARNLWQMHRYEEVKYGQRERPHLTRGSHARLRKLCWYPQTGKLCWYPHANKLLQKFEIFNKAINTHPRGLTEQHSYVWEPHRGCLHKVQKLCWCPFIGEGQQSHKYAF